MKVSTSEQPKTEKAAAIFKPPSRRAIERVNTLLVELYGQRTPLVRDPLDGLVLIILSQATNDINCDRAFGSLKETFPTWEEVLAAPVEDVAHAIRSGGLANQKAARIRRILQEIRHDQGALDLSWMHAASSQQCIDYLSKFHGVGPKTIACVLVFFLGKPAFPVDTHVHRVTKRLGWLRAQAGAEEAHRVLEAAVPDAFKLDLHCNLIAHGRVVCRAAGNGGPRCDACPLRSHCAFGKSVRTPAKATHNDQNTASNQALHGVPMPKKSARADFFVTIEPSEHSSEQRGVEAGSAPLLRRRTQICPAAAAAM